MSILLSLAAVAALLMVSIAVAICTNPRACLASGWWIAPSAICGAAMIGAAQLLGWESIAAIVENMTDEEAACAEIEENQQRGSLTVLERALGLAKLKEIYLKLHPDTARGKYDRGIKDNNDLYVFSASEALSGQRPARFTLEEAKKHGVDEKAIKRLVQIGEAITPELKAEIAGTDLVNNQAQLLKLVGYPEARRPVLARIMREEGYRKVSDADQHAEVCLTSWRPGAGTRTSVIAASAKGAAAGTSTISGCCRSTSSASCPGRPMSRR